MNMIDDTKDNLQEAGHRIEEGAEEAAHTVKEGLHEAGHRAGEVWDKTKTAVKEGYEDIKEEFDDNDDDEDEEE